MTRHPKQPDIVEEQASQGTETASPNGAPDDGSSNPVDQVTAEGLEGSSATAADETAGISADEPSPEAAEQASSEASQEVRGEPSDAAAADAPDGSPEAPGAVAAEAPDAGPAEAADEGPAEAPGGEPETPGAVVAGAPDAGPAEAAGEGPAEAPDAGPAEAADEELTEAADSEPAEPAGDEPADAAGEGPAEAADAEALDQELAEVPDQELAEAESGGGGTERAEMEATMEAILFVSSEPVPRSRLIDMFGGQGEQAAEALAAVLARYQGESGRGIMVEDVAGGVRLVTRPETGASLRRFFDVSGGNKLSMAALETLAIIAYRQPITGPEIQELRSVSPAGVLKTLLEKRLVRIAGRKEVVGKPFLYATTREFLVHFGLNSLRDLPPLEEFEETFGAAAGGAGAALGGDFGAPAADDLWSGQASDGVRPAGALDDEDREERILREAAELADREAAGEEHTPHDHGANVGAAHTPRDHGANVGAAHTPRDHGANVGAAHTQHDAGAAHTLHDFGAGADGDHAQHGHGAGGDAGHEQHDAGAGAAGEDPAAASGDGDDEPEGEEP
jgi:segregation and condensation protein B